MMDLKKEHPALTGMLFTVVVLLALLLFGWVSGFRLCAVVSGSMEPNLPTWSLCVVSTHADYDKIELGDVVVYNRRSDGLRIIHRVIAISDEGMETKGDANASSDGVSVGPDNLYGKMLFYIPYLGYVTKLTESLPAKMVIVIAIAALIASDIRDMSKKRAEDVPEEPEKTDGEE